MGKEVSGHLYLLPSAIYSQWSHYWASLHSLTPGLHFWKETLASGAVFIAPVGLNEVSAFVEAQAKNPEFVFVNQGTALLEEFRWIGHWCAFSAEPRAVHKTPVVPKVPPKPGEVRRWF